MKKLLLPLLPLFAMQQVVRSSPMENESSMEEEDLVGEANGLSGKLGSALQPCHEHVMCKII